MQTSSAPVKIFTFVAVLFLMPFVASADMVNTVSFLDGSDSPTFTDTTGRATGTCQGSACTVNIAAPQGFTWSGTVLVDVWVNPGSSDVRDLFCGDIYGFSGHCTFSSNMVTIQFVAEGQAPLGNFAAGMGLENGLLEQTGNIYWTNSAGAQITDSLTLTAGTQPVAVPEPYSLVLLTGLFILGLIVTRRRRSNPL